MSNPYISKMTADHARFVRHLRVAEKKTGHNLVLKFEQEFREFFKDSTDTEAERYIYLCRAAASILNDKRLLTQRDAL